MKYSGLGGPFSLYKLKSKIAGKRCLRTYGISAATRMLSLWRSLLGHQVCQSSKHETLHPPTTSCSSVLTGQGGGHSNYSDHAASEVGVFLRQLFTQEYMHKLPICPDGGKSQAIKKDAVFSRSQGLSGKDEGAHLSKCITSPSQKTTELVLIAVKMPHVSRAHKVPGSCNWCGLSEQGFVSGEGGVLVASGPLGGIDAHCKRG